MKKILIIIIAIVLVVGSGLSIISSFASQYAKALQEEVNYIGPYNDAVEVYRESVVLYSTIYSMTDYTDIIMKMISCYSDTHSTDIMNASFSYLNKNYPHKNEGITNADYSIQVGIEQLSQWKDYIISNYNINPITNENALLVLIQAYEIQDRGYIDYALSGEGYSNNNVITYCQSDSFTSEKSVSQIKSNFASVVNQLQLQTTLKTDAPATDTQKRIAQIALDYNNYQKNGITTIGGRCLNFTNDILSAAGLSIRRSDCARCAGDYWGVSNDWNSIPVGAEVYANASQQYGHVGIYVGDGYVVHCTTYRNSGATVLKTVPGGYVIKQPLQSFISDYHAKCWGFSGALSNVYPYQPGKYMNGLH
ncbi:MAG: lysozyme family protein [Lachnospiraceae bacterium]|nr:lysozyme family protein [Lachnospiraceae bacterium]